MNTELSLNATFTVPDTVVSRELDDELVLLNLESGLYFGLDAVGTRVWQVVAEGRSLAAARDVLLAEFDVEPAALEGDLLSLAGALIEKQLVGRA